MSRALLITFCLTLAGVILFVFTRVVAARVPEQRATLEKLISDHTGLTVRFDNVHFAWGLDGTSAVFTQVELEEPLQQRLHVRAPELRVDLDAWDFLRHHEFSFGNVTLVSPEIEIIAAPAPVVAAAPAAHASRVGSKAPPVDEERELLARAARWAEQLPAGKIEVLGARVHLIEPDRRTRTSITLSQAKVSRKGVNVEAFGTMLLAQDVGQSLFVSANLKNVGGGGANLSGEARLIARRVLLAPLAVEWLAGRGTVDAKIKLARGRIESATWQASARELELGSAARFDHVTVEGSLARQGDVLQITLANLQVTRGAQLQRAPSIAARIVLDDRRLHIARTTVEAEHVPFLAAEFLAGLLAPQLRVDNPVDSGDWHAQAGELRHLAFDSGPRGTLPGGWRLTGEVRELALERADRATLRGVAGKLDLDAKRLRLQFDAAAAATLRLGPTRESRQLHLAGTVDLVNSPRPALSFAAVDVRAGEGSLRLAGTWGAGAPRARPLAIELVNIDRAWLLDAWTVALAGAPPDALLTDIESATIARGVLRLVPDSEGGQVDWRHSFADLSLSELASVGGELPRLRAKTGRFHLERGSARLELAQGELESLTLESAELSWPRRGQPRLRAKLTGDLAAPPLRRALAPHGLDGLEGRVQLVAEARGEAEIQNPDTWRVSADLSAGRLPLADGLPEVTQLAGTLRYANRQLRAFAIAGEWLGGPVRLESRRSAARGPLHIALEGTADVAALAGLLGDGAITPRIAGRIDWTGSAQRAAGTQDWRINLASNLQGLESTLAEPFDKPRARVQAVTAALRVDAQGLREYELASGRDFLVRGVVSDALETAHFDVHGISGEFQRATHADATPLFHVQKLDFRRAPLVLAAAAALLPEAGRATFAIDDLRYSTRSFGSINARVIRGEGGIDFEFESPAGAQHRLAASGACASEADDCRAEFTADLSHLATLLRDMDLPKEWPTESLHAAGELRWPLQADTTATPRIAGSFELAATGAVADHQLAATGILADGEIRLEKVSGTGPEADQVFRGRGRIDYAQRAYDISVDYEKLALAGTPVSRPGAAKLARLWSSLRGSAAKRGWAEATAPRRVEWRGSWDEQP